MRKFGVLPMGLLGLVAMLAFARALPAATVGLAGVGPLDRDPKTLVQMSIRPNTPQTSYRQKVTLAVTFKIAPGWHIYWLNPGDSGAATALKLRLPVGWEQSDWRYPTPVKFEQPGDFVGYGYKDEVTFLVDVTPPQTFTEGEAKIEVEGVYLVCEAVCIPGQDKAVLTIPAGAPDYKTSYEEFVALEGKIPHRFGPTSGVKLITEGAVVDSRTWSEVSTRVQMPFGGGGGGNGGEKGWTTEVFPLESEEVEVRKLRAEQTDEGLVIKFEAKLYSGRTNVPPSIPAVVVTSPNPGHRTAFWADLPLSAGTRKLGEVIPTSDSGGTK